MKSTGFKLALAVIGLTIALLVYWHLNRPKYSLDSIHAELTAVCDEYMALREKQPPSSEWEAFETEARERIEPILDDLEENWLRSGGADLYQLARYELPETIQSQGQKDDRQLLRLLGQSRKEINSSMRGTPSAAALLKAAGTDPVTIAMVIFDVFLVAGFAYLWLKPVRPHTPKPKNHAARLSQLDRKIARHPDSAASRVLRARLLIEVGQKEEALLDIDWILANQPTGTDLEPWRRLRDSLAS